MFKRIKRLFTIVIILVAIVLLLFYGSQNKDKTSFTVYLDKDGAEYQLLDFPSYQPLAMGISTLYNGTSLRTKDTQLYLFFNTDIIILLDKYSEIKITSTKTQTVINQIAGQSWSSIKATGQYKIIADPYIITATDTSFNLQQLPNQDLLIAVTSGKVTWQRNEVENVAGIPQTIPKNKLVTLFKELIDPLAINLTAKQYDTEWFKMNKIIFNEFTAENPDKALLTRIIEALKLKGPIPSTTITSITSSVDSTIDTLQNSKNSFNQATSLISIFNKYKLITLGDNACKNITTKELIKDLSTLTDQKSNLYNYLLSLQTFCQDNNITANEKTNLNNLIKILTTNESLQKSNYEVAYQSSVSFNLNVKGITDPKFQKAIQKVLQKYTTIRGDGRQICEQYQNKKLKDIYQEINQIETQYNYSPRAAVQFTNILAGIAMACENGVISDVEKQSLIIIGP